MIDCETQTEESVNDKSNQVIPKLKRALQTIKDKINHGVIERTYLFSDIPEETMERIDYLFHSIDTLKCHNEQAQKEICELQK